MGERVLLVADEYYASLAAVRALRGAGYEPCVGATTPDGYAQRSRAAAAVVRLPDPAAGERFIAGVADAARAVGAAAILPGSEAAAVSLAARRDELAPVAVGASPPDVLRRVTDKAELAAAATAAGLQTPPSTLVRGGELDGVASPLRFPVVLKPLVSAVRTGDGARELPAAERIDGAELLRERVRGQPDVDWLVQPFVRGRLYAVAGVAWEGEVLCSVHQVARRIFPADCGVSAYAETVPRDADVDARIRGLLGSVGLSGIWEIQFVAGEGGLYLIDLNPRMYGSLGLAVAAGLNLPAIWTDLLLGRRPAVGDYRSGVRYRAEMRELGALASAARSGDLRGALAVLVPRRRTTHAVLSLRDPGPAGLLLRRVVARARVAV